MMKRIRTVAMLPTLFTLGNLVCGFYAITVASRVPAPHVLSDLTPKADKLSVRRLFSDIDSGNMDTNTFLAASLIFLAMIFDALDGHVARLAGNTSDFGAQLDSLADLVTFGVAPAFLMVKMCPEVSSSFRHVIWMVAATFACCAALRLARFNVETGEGEEDHMNFSGLPSPAAAGAIAGFALLFHALRDAESLLPHRGDIDFWVQYWMPVFALLLALLMVSRIPYPHVVNQFFRGQRSFAHMVAVVFAAVAVLGAPFYAVPILSVAYVLTPPTRYLWQRFYAHRTEAENEPLF